MRLMDNEPSHAPAIAPGNAPTGVAEAEQQPAGMNAAENETDLGVQADQLLRRIGWDPGHRIQTRIYARMQPARKMELALGWRQLQLDILRRRLQAEHPDLPPEEIQALLLRRIDWVREPRY